MSKRGDLMNQHYNRNYTKEQIEEVLKKIRESVRLNKYIISLNQNRKENISFINNYNITSKKQRLILLQIKVEDFCYSLQNIKLGFEAEVLYVFAPQVLLSNISGEREMVDIYTKFNVIELPNGVRTVVISFHKCNKPIQYLFK